MASPDGAPRLHSSSSPGQLEVPSPLATRQNTQTSETTKSSESSGKSSGSHGLREKISHTRDDLSARISPRIQYLAQRGRSNTEVSSVPTIKHSFPHKYLIRRPRALQFKYKDRVLQAGDYTSHVERLSHEELLQLQPADSRGLDGEDPNMQERSIENIEVQRQRVDLFVDLVWIGIISNISEHFYNQVFAPGPNNSLAVLEFVLLFLPAWRIWASLHNFLNVYFLDDFVQRILIAWVCLLGVVYGNNAPFFLSPDGHDTYEETSDASRYLIVVYLIAVMSIHLVEVVYSIWIHWLRRIILVGSIISIPAIGLWIATTLNTGWTQIHLLVSAICLDYGEYIFLASPIGERLTRTGDFHRARNLKYALERYENFFTIALGEGLFLLIRGSPLGSGFGEALRRGVQVFLVYWLLHYLYFIGDSSKKIIHAVYRRWYIHAIWQFMHVSMYGTLVILSSANLYLIDYHPDGESNGEGENPAGVERRSEVEVSTSKKTLLAATATAGTSIAIILFCQGVIALCNRPRDEPGTLIINNRYIRLAPRFMAVAVCATMYLAEFEDPALFLGLHAIILYVVYMWETTVSMEKGGGIIEPRSSRKSSRSSSMQVGNAEP